MKKLLAVLIAFCCAASVSAVGCKEDNEPQNDGVVYMHVDLFDSESKLLYDDSIWHITLPTLSLDEEYRLKLNFSKYGSTSVTMRASGITLRYDEHDVQVSVIDESSWDPQYTLRGLRECTNSYIEFYVDHREYNEDGEMIFREILRSCGIYVNFS